MLLLTFYATLLFNLCSSSIIGGLEPFPEVIERSSPSLNDVNKGKFIMDSIKEELQEHHNHYLGKLDILSAACKPSSSVSEGAFAYNVSTDVFRDPRINILVKVMSRKLQEIAEITMDDLNQKLERFRLLVTQRVVEKFTPLLSDIEELKKKTINLSYKEKIMWIDSYVNIIIRSSGDEVYTSLSSLPTKNDFITRSSRLMDLSEGIQRKIKTLKLCENSLIKDRALEMFNKLKIDLNAVEECLKIQSRMINDTYSNNAAELLQETLTMGKANGKVVTALSALLMELKHSYNDRLDQLKLDVEGTTGHVEAFSFSSITEEDKSQTEQTYQQTEDGKGIVNPLPCLDSRFIGHGRSLDICGAAVRLRKCYLQIVAFHCCRSCMDADLISTVPNMSASRNLSALKALTFLKPT